MNDDNFIIDQFTWSFSRLNSYNTCPAEWYRHYVLCEESASSAFAEFGSLMHSILEKYEKGELTLFDISEYYTNNYNEAIPTDFPNNKYVVLRDKYYDAGLEYLDNIDLPLDEYEILGVEKEVNFEIAGKPFIGFIDLLLKDNNTGEITILDHKSSSLKFKKNGEISKTDAEHFLSFKRQLYLYSKPLIESGIKVSYLEWNMFRDRKYVKIPWIKEEYDEAIKWAEDTIHMIENDEMWLPNPDNYYCYNLCSVRCNGCDYKPTF